MVGADLEYRENKNDLSDRSDAHKSFAEKDIEQWFQRMVHILPGEIILDIGCGTGNQILSYSKLTGETGFIHACDLQDDIIKKAQERANSNSIRNVKFHVHDMDKRFPFKENTFDLVSSCFAIYYSKNPEDLILEIRRVLKKEGRIFISGPTPRNTEEFWALHERISGKPVSDKARARRDRIRDVFIPLVKKYFKNVEIDIFENQIRFPTEDSVMKYYTASPIFIEGIPDASKKESENRMRDEVRKEIRRNRFFVIRKEVYGVLGYKD